MNTFYSIFLIYIPHHKNPEDPHSIEQRVPIEDAVFEFSLKIFKHPITKQICSIFYISSFVFLILSTDKSMIDFKIGELAGAAKNH
mgnify:CR=1 FL=1